MNFFYVRALKMITVSNVYGPYGQLILFLFRFPPLSATAKRLYLPFNDSPEHDLICDCGSRQLQSPAFISPNLADHSH